MRSNAAVLCVCSPSDDDDDDDDDVLVGSVVWGASDDPCEP